MTTVIYAAIAGLMFVGLALRTIGLRKKAMVAIGDGGQPLLRRAIRVHGNFAEYVPFALVLIWMAEMTTRSNLLAHALGILLITGRALHAYGVSREHENLRFRVVGMVMTFFCIVTASLVLLWTGLTG